GSIVERGDAFGLRTWELDDSCSDFLASAERVVREVRERRQPGYLVIRTARLGPHSKGDDLRDAAELDAIRRRDPLARLGTTIDPVTRGDIETRNRAFVDAIHARALEARESRSETPRRHMFQTRNADSSGKRVASVPAKNVRASLNGAL